MVEGHSVHRVAARHRERLVGKKFACTSPNGRFTEGAAAIDNKTFRAIEAGGENRHGTALSSVSCTLLVRVEPLSDCAGATLDALPDARVLLSGGWDPATGGTFDDVWALAL